MWSIKNNLECFKTIVSLFEAFTGVQLVCYGISVIIATFTEGPFDRPHNGKKI